MTENKVVLPHLFIRRSMSQCQHNITFAMQQDTRSQEKDFFYFLDTLYVKVICTIDSLASEKV